MVTLTEAAAPLDGLLHPVPPVTPGICRVCHHVPGPGYPQCASCHRTTSQVSRPLQHVLPMTAFQTGGQVWHHLRYYKDARDPAVRETLLIPLLAVLTRFLQRHGRCVAPDGWDAITCVPSTRHPEQPHPLLTGMQRVGSLRDAVVNLLGPGASAITHNHAADDGYRALDRGTERVLLADDTFTTGARLQSAASALSLAGYDIVGAVVIGRVFTPDFSDSHGRVWQMCEERAFDPDVCAACDEPW